VGADVAVAVGVWGGEGMGVCVGVAPGLQATSNTVNNKGNRTIFIRCVPSCSTCEYSIIHYT
jgi:hypothetical protein